MNLLLTIREAAGIVEQVGAKVQGFKVGDRVAYVSTNTYAQYGCPDAGKIQKIKPQIRMKMEGGSTAQIYLDHKCSYSLSHTHSSFSLPLL